MTKQEAVRNEAREYLLNTLGIKRGDTVYTKLNHVSRSGMSRTVDVYIIKENEPLRISWRVCEAIGFSYDRKHEGVKVGGCGMDVGFEVVYNLSMALFCPGKYDHDAAYALKHRWL